MNGRLERIRLAVDRHLVLLHRLEQRRLRLRRGAVDLVDQQDVGEDRPGPELELVRALVEDVDARDVRREQVGRELDPREVDVERARERLREHRLPHAREVLDDHVPLGEQAEDAELERVGGACTTRARFATSFSTVAAEIATAAGSLCASTALLQQALDLVHDPGRDLVLRRLLELALAAPSSRA